MTLEEIKIHFNGMDVYQFNGRADELVELLIVNGVSHNYIVVDEVPYFVASNGDAVPEDSRIVKV
jgi:hypothetical protein